jgi:hypothetical protein
MSNIDDLAAALDNHSVTDEEGQVGEENSSEESPVEESATAEKSEDKDTLPKEEPKSENEPEMVPTAEDDSGKRYVPEERFKQVYAKMKDLERKAQTPFVPEVIQPSTKQKPIEKQDALEIELLRATVPQFNPESSEYSREVDELGFHLYEGSKDSKGNHTMTRIEAGRRALDMAKKITSKVADVKYEARTVKVQQSDQGITNRVSNRGETKVEPDKMSFEEKEAWLKETGNW